MGTVSQSMGIETMASHLLLAAFALSFVHQIAGFSTGRCQEEQLLKILANIKSCSAGLRWSSDYCAKHAQIENCLERAFQACFSNSVAQKLVRGEKARLRLKIEAEWGNKIQVDELEKLFKGCTYIAARPPPGLLQRLHWIDFVHSDGNCGYKAKEEVKIITNNIINVITIMCSFNTNIIIIITNININIVMNGRVKKWISFEAPLTDSSNLP